jgi:hypothetical protein
MGPFTLSSSSRGFCPILIPETGLPPQRGYLDQAKPPSRKEAAMMDMKNILTHHTDCSVRPVGSGLVIVTPQGDETHSIEELGAFIWNLIDGQNDLDAILNEILAEYEVTAETAARDLHTFISQLLEAGLVLQLKQRV